MSFLELLGCKLGTFVCCMAITAICFEKMALGAFNLLNMFVVHEY